MSFGVLDLLLRRFTKLVERCLDRTTEQEISLSGVSRNSNTKERSCSSVQILFGLYGNLSRKEKT
jgi:hypothetical protein